MCFSSDIQALSPSVIHSSIATNNHITVMFVKRLPGVQKPLLFFQFFLFFFFFLKKRCEQIGIKKNQGSNTKSALIFPFLCCRIFFQQ
jgi:hypothetical protein